MDVWLPLPLTSVAVPLPEEPLPLTVDVAPDAVVPPEAGRLATEESTESVPMLVLTMPFEVNVPVETDGGCEESGVVSEATGEPAVPDMPSIL